MADQITLTAEPREGAGKGEARALRREGRVPAIVYGPGVDTAHLTVDARELRHALATDAGENAVITLKTGDGDHLTMPREIHRHPVRRDVLHLDFVAIRRDVEVTVDVPLVVTGDAAEGAVVSQALNVLTITVLPLSVPESIEVSVDGLQVGDVVRAGEIALPEGVTLVGDPEDTAVSVTVPDADPDAEAAEAEAADAEGEDATAEEAGEDAAAAADEGDGE